MYLDKFGKKIHVGDYLQTPYGCDKLSRKVVSLKFVNENNKINHYELLYSVSVGNNQNDKGFYIIKTISRNGQFNHIAIKKQIINWKRQGF